MKVAANGGRMASTAAGKQRIPKVAKVKVVLLLERTVR